MAENTCYVVGGVGGNVKAVSLMLERIGLEVHVVDTPPQDNAALIVLPGVGSFDPYMAALDSTGWKSALASYPRTTKIMGICLGMHALGIASDEGKRVGLGLLDVRTQSISATGSPRPHLGWTRIRSTRRLANSEFLDGARCYFSHSFGILGSADCALATFRYGGVEYAAAIGSSRILGLQFHPEKSYYEGANVVGKWLELS